MEHHLISAEHLSIDRVREILVRRLPLALSDDARARIVRCREYLDRKMENPERPIYGITTGFGSLCDISVGMRRAGPAADRTSSCRTPAGPGERVPSEIVRLILLLKIQSLSYGHSGVQLATVERLDRVFQPRRPARGLPAGVARRFGRPGAAGAYEPAAAGTGRGGVRRA